MNKKQDDVKRSVIDDEGRMLFRFFRDIQADTGFYGCWCNVCESSMIKAYRRLLDEKK